MGEGRRINIDIPMEEGDPLGAVPDEKLHIVRVQPMTLADGKLKVGDQILSLNGTKVQDRDHFYKLLRYAHPCAELVISRREGDAPAEGGAAGAAPQALENQIPPEREKLIDRHAGFEYSLVRINIAKGKRLGLGIRDVSNRVLVSKVEKSSLADGLLQVRDHIIDVEGTRVTDKDVARELLIRSMRAKGYFTCVVGRPVTDEAKKLTDTDLSIKSDPPSVKLSDDVREIAQRQRQKEQQMGNQQRAPVLSAGGAKERPRVSFNEGANNKFDIGNDNKGKALRPVRK